MSKELKNKFAWSKSRHETFDECPRKYYFQYYGSWGGWNRDAEPRTRELYILKNLETRQMWAGKHVHRAIEEILKEIHTGRELPPEEITGEGMLEAMRNDFKQSRAGAYRENPKKACGLFEHEYNIQVSDEQWKQSADNARLCLHNFYVSALLKEIRKMPEEAWLEVEQFSGFSLSGLRVLVQLDFAFRAHDIIHIYDWKTGKSDFDNSQIQLACYVLYAVDKWKVARDKVTASALYLADNIEKPATLDEERLQDARDFIQESADEMSFLLADPQNNIPVDEDEFGFAENEWACKRCNFLKVCPKFHQ